MNINKIALMMKYLIEKKEFFLYPHKSIENIYDIILHKQIWFEDYFINFVDGSLLLKNSFEYQKSIIYNMYSEMRLKNKFKKLFFYEIIVFEENCAIDLYSFQTLCSWLDKQNINIHLILIHPQTHHVTSLFSNFYDKENLILSLTKNLSGILQTNEEEINLLNIERQTKKVKGYYFTVKNAYFTKALVAANIIIFAYMSLKGNTTDIYHLIQFGAKYNPLIADGQYYRLVTNMFIHIGIIHLILNAYALNVLGKDIEAIYGPIKFFMIYIISGILGSLGSFLFSPSVSAGASGAIFGLIGAYLYFGIRYPAIFSARYGMNLISLLIINIIFGLSNSTIDNFAHFGGLIGGVLASWALGFKNEKILKRHRFVVQLSILLVTAGLLFAGVQINRQTWEYDLHKGVRYLQQENFLKAQKHFEAGLDKNPNVAEFYFYLAYIYYHQGRKDTAIKYLEKTLLLNPNNPIAKNFLDNIKNK